MAIVLWFLRREAAHGLPGTPWTSVTATDWLKAERAAGFRGGGDGPATGGFGSSSGLEGRYVNLAVLYDRAVKRWQAGLEDMPSIDGEGRGWWHTPHLEEAR